MKSAIIRTFCGKIDEIAGIIDNKGANSCKYEIFVVTLHPK